MGKRNNSHRSEEIDAHLDEFVVLTLWDGSQIRGNLRLAEDYNWIGHSAAPYILELESGNLYSFYKSHIIAIDGAGRGRF